MILKVLFKIFFFIFLYSVGHAELLKPSIGGEKKEILKISDKRRVYTVLSEDSLVYEIYGPARLELIARYPSNKKTQFVLMERPLAATRGKSNYMTFQVKVPRGSSWQLAATRGNSGKCNNLICR